LHTPALECGILDGITRTIVMTLAQEERIPIEEGRYQLAVLRRADECFLTNTTMEIMPVTRIDTFPIGNGLPGPLTRRLQAAFAAARPRFLESIL
jgi:branched-chain amino acid aminotransferase